MKKTMLIRPERERDIRDIHRITDEAFRSMPFSDGTEPVIIDRLRECGELTLSLVAAVDGAVVGHVAFSPATIAGSDESDWYGLGPVAVDPPRQRTGIGTALIETGLRTLRDRRARGVVLVGDPAYYRRFGFVGDGRLRYESLSEELVQWLAYGTPPPFGELWVGGNVPVHFSHVFASIA